MEIIIIIIVLIFISFLFFVALQPALISDLQWKVACALKTPRWSRPWSFLPRSLWPSRVKFRTRRLSPCCSTSSPRRSPQNPSLACPITAQVSRSLWGGLDGGLASETVNCLTWWCPILKQDFSHPLDKGKVDFGVEPAGLLQERDLGRGPALWRI